MLFDVMVLRKLNSLVPVFILDEDKVLSFATFLVSKNGVKDKNMAPWYAVVYVQLTLVS
jgi:hypothetical protein